MSLTGQATYTSAATIWRQTGNDGYGKTWADPVVVLCTYRIGSKQKYVDTTGAEFAPTSQIWTEMREKYSGAILSLPAPTKDMILIGESTEASPIIAGADVIASVMGDDESMFGELPDYMILTKA